MPSIRCALLLLLLAICSAPLAAQGPDATADARVDALQRQLADLSMQLRILARQIEIEKEAAAERSRTAAQPVSDRGGFALQSGDGEFRVRLRGYVQSDGRFFVGDPEARGTDTFLLRRVRPIVDATLYRIFDVRVMPDFGGGTTVLQDAYVDMRFRPGLKVRAGKFKAPFGLERLLSATEMPLIERALPTALVPNRDLGVMVHGDLAAGRLAYAAGVFNGVADGASADADGQDSKDLVGRLFAQPFRSRRDSRLQGLGAGLAASYGVHRGSSAAASALPVFRTAGQVPFFAYRGDDPTVADGVHTRVSAQGHYYAGAFGLIGEHVVSQQRVRRGTNARRIVNDAWQLTGTWVLTGEAASVRGVAPRTRFDPDAGTWGAFELTARYSALDVDRHVFPLFASPQTAAAGADAWAGGVNWYLNGGVKLQVNFERTTFEVSGAVRRRAEHDLLTRVQFSF